MTVEKPLSQGEFIALIAALFATIAISIDAMLPAMPEIAATLSPDAPNRAQLVVTSFVFGMGLGTLIAGPLSDAFGRKIIILLGSALYVVAAIACYFAKTLDFLLIARVVQGFGAAAPRVVSTAMVRDLFSGREMARVMSFVMMVFTLVPAVAPLMGQAVIYAAGWHAIFLVYVVFSIIILLWMGLRQPETLAVAARRPLSVAALWAATKEVFSSRVVLVSIIAQSLTLAALFATLSSMQGIFEQRFDRATSFPSWFALIAMVSMGGSIINAKVVIRLGMRKVVTRTYAGVVVLTLILLGITSAGLMPEPLAFPAHILWSIALFAMMGLSMGNLNALAMEPVGHIAGFASSVIGAIATVVSVVLAVPVGLAFDGTARPLMAGVLVFISMALLSMRFAGPARR
ncbi:MAG: multidrug MFS transporter [Rhodobacterales bacterium RIFCSPHIGHO2_02_FULL_62_130]|nr:MAG: multidrug MFS transporter [Rhodobacterales bacterium RIFCSPHIGHO2_02_FULL_62_130]OHC54337.1 MAG: multidrug MFS transporter [Rhodobacterales bacterium RIFCSPHIGHO2_12_FULL_62_75]HCY98507.1 multidrug MFS transporter [Rhodobacter sp.]